MKSLFSPAVFQGLEGVEVLTCTAYTHPSHRNPVNNLDSTYQFVRLAVGKHAIMLAFDHPSNKGASVFNALEDVRAALVAQAPSWWTDSWYVGQPEQKRYVYTPVDFDDNGWTTFNDRVPTSSLTHQYSLSFEALRDLVHDVQRGTTKVEATEATA